MVMLRLQFCASYLAVFAAIAGAAERLAVLSVVNTSSPGADERKGIAELSAVVRGPDIAAVSSPFLIDDHIILTTELRTTVQATVRLVPRPVPSQTPNVDRTCKSSLDVGAEEHEAHRYYPITDTVLDPAMPLACSCVAPPSVCIDADGLTTLVCMTRDKSRPRRLYTTLSRPSLELHPSASIRLSVTDVATNATTSDVVSAPFGIVRHSSFVGDELRLDFVLRVTAPALPGPCSACESDAVVVGVSQQQSSEEDGDTVLWDAESEEEIMIGTGLAASAQLDVGRVAWSANDVSRAWDRQGRAIGQCDTATRSAHLPSDVLDRDSGFESLRVRLGCEGPANASRWQRSPATEAFVAPCRLHTPVSLLLNVDFTIVSRADRELVTPSEVP